uniref:Cytochrome P450 4c21 n=1 Tax=Cacopsylla melanoneura TaxID=428564 RepID=A0A8D8U9W4_9HEMI
MLGPTPLLAWLLIMALLYIIILLWKHRRYFRLGFRIPGPSSVSNVSILYSLSVLRSMETMTQYIMDVYETERSKGLRISKYWLGPHLMVFIDDVDMVSKVLHSHLHKSKLYNLMSHTRGHALLEQRHLATWSKHRKFVGNSFRFFSLKSYTRIFHEEATILTAKLNHLAVSGESFEPQEQVGLAALNALTRSMFGVDCNIQQENYIRHPYLQAVESSFEIFTARMLKPWLYLDFAYKLSGYKEKSLHNRTIQKEFIRNIIEKVKTKIIEENQEMIQTDKKSLQSKFEQYTKEKEDNEALSKTHKDYEENGQKIQHASFVELALRASMNYDDPNNNTAMTEKELIHEMVGILNAGFDTVKITTTIVLNILAIHPELQEEVYNEIISVLGDSPDSVPTYDQIHNLDLLTRVIKETMRLYSPVPFIARKATEEFQLDDYIIPAGCTIAIIIQSLHRHPTHWPEPTRFDPDRFLPSEIARRNPNAYLPFSVGPRNCLGYKYGMIQMKTTLSTLLRRYKILTGDKCKTMEDIRYQFGLTLKVLPGNDIRLETSQRFITPV